MEQYHPNIMATQQRAPLGDHTGTNIPRESAPTTKPSQEDKPRRSELENKRIERKASTRQSVSDLKRDMAKAQATFAKSIEKDADVPRSSTPNDSLEVKLQDLVQRHQVSKTRHATELSSLHKANKALHEASTAAEAEVRAAREENQRLAKELAAAQQSLAEGVKEELRKKNDELEVVRRQLDAAKAECLVAKKSFTTIMREDQGKWEQETQTLQRELEILRKENEKLVAREDKVEQMEVEREWLEEALAHAAERCGRQHVLTVHWREHDRVRCELEALKLGRIERKSVEYGLRHELRLMKEEVEMCRERMEEADAARREMEQLVSELLEQRKADRCVSMNTNTPSDLEIAPLGPLIDPSELLSVEETHAALETMHARQELRSLLLDHRSLLAHSDRIAETSNKAEHALRALRHDQKALEEKCSALVDDQSRKAHQIALVEQEVSRWQDAEKKLSAELHALKEQHTELQRRARSDKEVLKRANDTVMRSKAAEDAFEQEIIQLREALDEAAQYRDLYNELLEENRLLVVREELAAEEAERLGHQNAELVGHANGDQKISYVDGLRREMILVKHELAFTRNQLNKANEKIGSLSREIEAYKSVDLGVGLSSSTRTRVVRRVPEGSWLGASTSVRRSTTRSVSGPLGR